MGDSMKKLLILLILIFTPFLADARGLMMMGGGVAAATPAGAWLYNGGSDDYPNSGEEGNTYAVGGVSGTKSCTKVSVKLTSVGTSTACKVALYISADGIDYTVVYGGTVASPATGWNDVTLTSSSITSASIVSVMAECNNTWTQASKTGIVNTYHFHPVAYADFPAAITNVGHNADEAKGVRLWLE
jgi:hypothetical protein